MAKIIVQAHESPDEAPDRVFSIKEGVTHAQRHDDPPRQAARADRVGRRCHDLGCADAGDLHRHRGAETDVGGEPDEKSDRTEPFRSSDFWHPRALGE